MTEKNYTVDGQLRKFPSPLPKFLIELAAIIVIYFLANYTLDFSSINDKGLKIAVAALKGLLHPSIDLITRMDSSGLLYMLMETLAIAFLGTIIGIVLALPLAFLSSRNIAPRWVNYICLTIISIIRAFPAFMYGIMFVRVTSLGAYAGVLTMAVSSIGMLAKLLIEAIEDMNPGINEALDASGCSAFEKIRYGIIPQLSSNIISIVIYRLDINVKNASILGVVGAGGIGASLIFSIGKQAWDEVGAMLFGLVVLVLVLEYFSTRIRKKLAVGE